MLNTLPFNPYPPSTANKGNNNSPYELPIASSNELGGVKVGTGLSINENGVLSNNNPTPYTPIDYSTDEKDTGIKWIDGKEIYQKTIKVLSSNFITDGNLYRIDNPLFTGDNVIKIEALAHSSSYGDVTLGLRTYSDNTPSAFWEMIAYYNYIALHFSGLTYSTVVPEYIIATYYYTKTTESEE